MNEVNLSLLTTLKEEMEEFSTFISDALDDYKQDGNLESLLHYLRFMGNDLIDRADELILEFIPSKRKPRKPYTRKKVASN